MSISHVEYSASLQIGTVEFVSPDKIKVVLDLESPDSIAANAGIPRAFPRVNSYVLVATDSGHIVAQVEWIAVERSPFPNRKGFQDHGLVDLPFSLRKMRANPLGILKKDDDTFVFKRGVHGFPSVGEPVLIPTDEQLKAVIESGEKKRVKIGTSPMAANADVWVDPDRLFGRHLAVLGNTGSGKSCSVAGLIRWSIAAAKEETGNSEESPNARFIVLDPNGEYSKVFQDDGRVFKVGNATHPLKVPLWFWNSAEWSSFTQASARAQVPLIKSALRDMRNQKPKLKGKKEKISPSKSEDIPSKFEGEEFLDRLKTLAKKRGNEHHVEPLLTRVDTMLADTLMKNIIGDDIDISLKDWLDNYIGKNNAEDGCVTIIDLSLVPADIVHIVTTVVARMVFEALQRYRERYKESLPTVLVMEEAHTFANRYKENAENQSVATVCCQMFEKIAREGRKFGLGLVLSSQRPSELSSTVISQCNSFLLHRVSNDRDQELIQRFVPDNLRGLLRELPSLPSQQAILLGWASELPIMVRMNDLEGHERPQSDDPDFWDVWSGAKERLIDWEKIADDW